MPHKLQNWLGDQEGVNYHILDGFGRFMIVDHFMKFEPGCVEVVYLVGILNVVANLIVQHSCRVYESKDINIHL